MAPTRTRKTNTILFSAYLSLSFSAAVYCADEKARVESPVNIQDSPASEENYQLDEIIVTAQKREEKLQDVPISVSVVTRDAMSAKGINGFDSLSKYVPNLQIDQAQSNTSIFMRGLGSSGNTGFEQTVGMYIDGIYFGNQRHYRGSFFDLDRVEVLRGPQSTLFGKNTIAGAINVTTALPTEEFQGEVGLGVGNLGDTEISGVLSGSLQEHLLGRLAFLQTTKEPFMEDTDFAGSDGYDVEQWGMRGTLQWTPQDDLEIITRLELGKHNSTGGVLQVVETGGQVATNLFLSESPNAEFRFDDQNAMGGLGPEFQKTDKNIFSVTVNSDRANGTVTSITGYNDFLQDDSDDTDASSLPLIHNRIDRTFKQFSQELRFTSKEDDRFEYIYGAYYEYRELQNEELLTADLQFLQDYISSHMSEFTGIDAFIASTLLTQKLPNGIADRDYFQESSTWSFFFDNTWHIRDDLRLSSGFRYVLERKNAELGHRLLNRDGTPVTVGGDNEAGFHNFGFYEEYAPQGTLKKPVLLPSVSLQYDLDPDVMIYTSLKRGGKSGGFNPESRPLVESGELFETDWQFDAERANAYELGFKSTLLDRKAIFNGAFYHTQFRGLQVSTLESSGVVVSNAAEATSWGLELDSRYRLTDSLTIGGSYAYLNATYDDFKTAAPTAIQLQEMTLTGVPKADQLQDLTGEVLQMAPENSYSLFIDYYKPLTDIWEINTGVDVNFIDDFFYQQDNDPIDSQDANTKLNAFISFINSQYNSQIQLIGKNLTNEQTAANGWDIPILSEFIVFGDGAHTRMTDAPRTYEVRFLWRF